jgi:hypothetical protein
MGNKIGTDFRVGQENTDLNNGLRFGVSRRELALIPDHELIPLVGDSWAVNDAEYLIDGSPDGYRVIRSPYYTECRHADAGRAGAGDLDRPLAGGVKAYCLGPEFFSESGTPYKLFPVRKGVEYA